MANLIGTAPDQVPVNGMLGDLAFQDIDSVKSYTESTVSSNTVSLKSFYSANTGSTNIGTIQSGTGAVSRTLLSKLNDVISVKDFGALGDGITDDTISIQAAITAGAGKKIIFPSGTYLTKNITLVSNIEIVGEENAIIKIYPFNYTSSDTRLFTSSVKSNITIRNITFDGNKGNIGTFNNSNVVVFYKTTNFKLESCNWVNCEGISLQISDQTEKVIIKNCNFKDCGGLPDLSDGYRHQAIAFSTDIPNTVPYRSKGVLITECSFLRIGLDCISLGNCDDVIVSNCIAEDSYTFIYNNPYPYYSSNVIIQNNNITNTTCGTLVDAVPPIAIDLPSVQGGIISGNQIYKVSNAGIGIFTLSNNIIVSNNNIINPQQKNTSGGWDAGIVIGSNISIATNITDIQITNNTIIDTFGYMLRAINFRNDVVDLYISDNIIKGAVTSDYGFYATLSGPGPTTTSLTDISQASSTTFIDSIDIINNKKILWKNFEAKGSITSAAITATNLAYTGTLTGSTGILNIGSGQLYKDASGNVGIGTSTISSRLSIKGTTTTDAPTLGTEFITGGTWTSTGWTGDNTTGWVNGASNVSPLSYSVAAVISTKYQIAYTVTRSAGSFTITFGGQSNTTITATGTFGPTATTTGNLVITPTSTFVGTIVISIKAINTASTALITALDSTGTSRFEVRASSASVNTFLGENSGKYNTTGYQNLGIGVNALQNNTTGNNNTAVGYSALNQNTTGFYNIGIGVNALFSNTTGYQNLGVGVNALFSNTTGYQNLSIGGLSLFSNTTGANNTAVGFSALNQNTTGSNLSAFGYQALYANLGINNSAFGYWSLRTNTLGIGNTAIGLQALLALSSAVATLGTVTGGSGYTTPGTYTGVQLTYLSGTAISNIGTYPIATIVVAGGVVTTVTLTSFGTGFKDTTTVMTCAAASIGGSGSGFSVPVATLATGSINTAIGYNAGSGITTGSNNVVIGGYTGAAAPISATGSNYIVLSDGAGNVRQVIDSSGNVGIGTSSPSGKLGLVTTGSTAAWQIVANNTGVSNQSGIYADASNNMQFAARDGSGVLRVVIDSNSSTNSYINSGNVGIGTSSPGAILHTFKTSAAAATVGAFIQNNDNTVGTEVRLGFAANTNLLSQDRYGWIGYVNTGGVNGGALTFATTPGGTPATERMRIDSSGNVGIGNTPSGTYKLEVSGNISSTTLTSTVATGTAPFTVTSTTPVTNLSIGGNANTATSVAGGVANNVLYQTAAGATAFVPVSTVNGQVLTTVTAGGAPTWVSPTTGTVTSVAALTLGTTGTDVSSTVATGTTTPVITLNIPTASATNRGALSSADWTTFNNKQPAGSYLTASTGVTTFNGGTTGLTPSTNTSGAITLAGTLIVGNGGTGVATLSGVAFGNGISAFTAATSAQLLTAIGVANTTTSGYLSSTDWNTFNGKQASGTYVTSVTGTAPVVSSGGTAPAISMAAATSLVNGYMTSTYASKLDGIATGATANTGTVTSVAAITLTTTGTDITSSVATGTTTPVITLNVPTASATNRGLLSSADWSTFNNKGSGTVTSVGFTGGLLTIATATTTPAITVAGTSGGIPYFSSASTWASSAALTASALVIGGGAGIAPSTTTTGTGVLTALGVAVGSAGAFVTFNGALGTPSSGTLTNCTFPTLNQNTTGSSASCTGNAGTVTTVTAANLAGAVTPSTSGNVLTSDGTSWISAAANGGFATGTALLFYQAAAPTGWTKSVTNNDKALRVVSGTTGGTAGGSVAFSTAFASKTPAGTVSVGVSAGTLAVGIGTLTSAAVTLATTQIPSHTHTYFQLLTSTSGAANGSPFAGLSSNTGATGGGTSHTHTLSGAPSISGSLSLTSATFSGTAINLAVQYCDVIIATKN